MIGSYICLFFALLILLGIIKGVIVVLAIIADKAIKKEMDKQPIIANCLKISSCNLTPNTFDSLTNVTIWFQNISNKTIKYITFHTTIYNSVNDIIGYLNLKNVGFVSTNEIVSPTWEDVVKYNTAHHLKIYEIEIIYNDNSVEHITNNEIKY